MSATQGVRVGSAAYAAARRFRLSPLAAAITALITPHALAQQSGKQVEEIIVTGTKRELNLQDVPQSITAFSQETIEKMAFRSMDDYMKALPSASLTNSMPGRNSISMRGISTGNSEFRTDSQVAIYLDEQPITSISQQPEIHIVDIERIENLPGPQGTLFGSSSQSGTLRIITNKPNFDGTSAQIDASATSTKDGEPGYEVSGHVNFTLIPDKLAIRVVGFSQLVGGYVDNVVGPTISGKGGAHGSPATNIGVADDDQNEFAIGGGRISVLWNVSEDWKVDLNYIRQDSQANGTWESDPYLGSYKVTRFFDEYRNDDWWQVAGTIRGDLGFAQLISTTSYFDRDISYEWDNMAYNQWQTSYYGNYGVGRYDFEYEFGSYFNFQKQDRFAQEIRLTSQGESKLDWMVGAFFEEVEDKWDAGAWIPHLRATNAWKTLNDYACYYESRGHETISCPLQPTTKTYDNRYHKIIDQTAVFGELGYHFTDKFNVIFGARWFQFDRQDNQRYSTPEGLPPAGSWGEGQGRYSSDGEDNDTVLKVALQYHFDDQRMIYALFSEGPRLGGVNSPRAVASGLIPQSYGPDTMKNYEAGLKSEWLDRTLQVNATVFLMRWEDIQLNISPDAYPFWLRGTINGKGGESLGTEVSVLWQPNENLTLDTSVFVADAEYTDDTYLPIIGYDNDGDPIGGDLVLKDGTEMPNSPEEKYRIGVEYRVPQPFGLPGAIRLRYDTTYTGEYWDNRDDSMDKDPRGLIPDSWYTNAQIGYDSEKSWQATLLVRNLWDDQGITNIIRTTYKSVWFHDERFRNERTLYAPRTITLALSYKFD